MELFLCNRPKIYHIRHTHTHTLCKMVWHTLNSHFGVHGFTRSPLSILFRSPSFSLTRTDSRVARAVLLLLLLFIIDRRVHRSRLDAPTVAAVFLSPRALHRIVILAHRTGTRWRWRPLQPRPPTTADDTNQKGKHRTTAHCRSATTDADSEMYSRGGGGGASTMAHVFFCRLTNTRRWFLLLLLSFSSSLLL